MVEKSKSKLLEDQRSFMSLNATLMYVSKRTFPEISFTVVYLSPRYNKAREDDYVKAMRLAEYIVGSLSYPITQISSNHCEIGCILCRTF